MASSAASSDRPDLSALDDDSPIDPFISSTSTGPSHFRFSNFDHELFAAGPGSSPRQAKRALEAHLAETDRRLDEAGKLGTALVGQRKALAEQLQEVDKLQTEAELNPELRQKLVEIEREYNDLARESARVFLPKQRVPSGETDRSSPYLTDRSGRRSVSPSKFESQATGSPTKLTVPNRKIRNQPSNRVHDIEFAAEISTSLIAQVRNLQALLGERDEQVKDLRNDMSRVEHESEAFQQRLKILDESEHRYKEENWNLQTRLQEVASQQRDASDREKKLNHSLQAANTGKTAAQKELDEVKLSHTKLAEEYATATKHHDIELGTAKRNIAMVEGERAVMQRKIDDLISQNQEFAKLISAQRVRSQERESDSAGRLDHLELEDDNVTPEHSPPTSPVKITPRHSMLEAETIKTSLQHAQRTIQSQRSQLHREKTEKLELRRIIQDLRDDLEKARNDLTAGGGVPMMRRGRKVEPKEPIKKPPRLLGTFRSSRQEILPDDPEWEDTHDMSCVPPRRTESPDILPSVESGDNFETANEASESAFETAHERTTETEGFQTGNEGYSDTDGVATETDGRPSRGFGGMKAPSLSSGFARHGYRNSIDSTASTSTDTDEDAYHPQLRTPSAAASHKRYRSNRGAYSRSRQASEEPYQSSPAASFVSRGTATAQTGQSLFAELQDFGSDDDSIVYTPGRRSARSMTPGSTRRALSPPPPLPEMPKLIMVDSGMMTEPVEFATDRLATRSSRASLLSVAEVARRPRSMESVVQNPDFRASTSWRSIEEEDLSRPASTVSYSDAGAQYDDIDEKLKLFPIPPTSSPRAYPPTPPSLILSLIQSEDVEPLEEFVESPIIPALSMTPILTQVVEPLPEPEIPPLSLSMSLILAEGLEPVEEPETPPPALSMSGILFEGMEPIEEPEVPPPSLSLSMILAENLEPKSEPESPPPSLTLSTILTEGLEPIAEPETPPPALSLSTIFAEDWEPRAEPEVLLPMLGLSGIIAEGLEPKAEPKSLPPRLSLIPIHSEVLHPIASPSSPELVATRDIALSVPVQPELSMSSVIAEHVEPVSEPEVVVTPPSLGWSLIQAEELEPKEEPVEVAPIPTLVYSDIAVENVQPLPELEPLLPAFEFSSIITEHTSPIEELPPALPALVLSPISGEGVQPVSPPLQIPIIPNFAFSSIESIETRPMTPRSPRREGFILPHDIESPFTDDPSSEMSKSNLFAKFLDRQKSKDVVPIIAEDETRQSTPDSDAQQPQTPESDRPFREISTNADPRLSRKQPVQTSDQGAQTSLTAGAIDQLLKTGPRIGPVHGKSPVGSPEATGSIRIHRQDSFENLTPGYHKARSLNDGPVEAATARRPGSAKSAIVEAPPLPSNHQQIIHAARSGSAGGPQSQGNMGPPLWPASALKGRPRTPNQPRPMSATSGRGTPTPRPVRGGSSQSNAEFQSPAKASAAVSRQSSVSSFASELDTRFNMRPNDLGVDAPGFGPNTDPRMIQAITQTMIGEYLWKYTRKTGRGELSEKRHRRYFWVHPYTRTIYWSERDPSTAGRSELRAKSLPIEAVRVVTDDNPMPPGLHRKSLVIVSPGRTIKFTCTTGQRHETWFNALSYLLLRTSPSQQHSDAEDMAENITREDVDEFNPQFARRAANGGRPTAPSLSSYNSRTTRNESQFESISLDIPTLNGGSKYGKSNMGSLGSKLGGYLRGGPKLTGTLRGRTSNQNMIYETSEAHDSAEDLREMIERQDREADRLENVRACCDGKHDVGTLPHRRSRTHIHLHPHPHPGHSTMTTPMTSMRSRA
ncbi:Anucleate primary sterigmata protein A [Cladobotryum mycophilum]|uniref:Anucleate primary sterigmata protein A n=1 Tax=Cladobotryum mycophilum TaxID=491253 RepID=A0ABR0T3Z7_9HYPO